MSKEELISWVGSWLIRAVSFTLRVRVVDEAGFFSNAHQGRYIFTFWHNRMFVLPRAFERFYGARKGAVVLTSASKDGASRNRSATNLARRPTGRWRLASQA